METLPVLGGLKLTNLGMFDLSLKVSWIKRLANQGLGWAEFPIKYGILKVLKYGENFPKDLSLLKNKFWFDMLRGIIRLNETFKYNKVIQVQNIPLWYSSIFELGYRNNWEKRGYHTVNDILNKNGEVLTRGEMVEKGLKIHFLDYFKLSKKIRLLMQDKENRGKRIGPFLPRILVETGLNIKRCSNIYNRLMVYNGNTFKGVKEKWEEILNKEINYRVIQTAFKEIPKLKENAYQKYLQFKILQTRTASNDILNKMEIKDSNKCLLCYTETEDIKHAFLECSKVKNLWNDIEKCIKDKTRKTVKLSHRLNFWQTKCGGNNR